MKLDDIFMAVVMSCVVIGIMLISWHFKLHINWKLGYKGKVDDRIEVLEQRIDALENILK